MNLSCEILLILDDFYLQNGNKKQSRQDYHYLPKVVQTTSKHLSISDVVYRFNGSKIKLAICAILLCYALLSLHATHLNENNTYMLHARSCHIYIDNKDGP